MTDNQDSATARLEDHVPLLDADRLLGPEGRVFLRHGGTIYTLRVTRNDKLILTK